MIKVSVVITTYNAEQYIIETLDSIKQQNIGVSNYEVIIVDDGSKDKTITLIEEYQEKNNHFNIKFFKLKHIGRGEALQYAVNQVAHEYLAIIDADDLWNVNKLKIQIEFIEKYKLDFLSTQAVLFTNNDEKNLLQNFEYEVDKNFISEITMEQLVYRNNVPHSSVIIKKEYANYDGNRKSQLDCELWFRLLFNGIRLYNLKLPLSLHRIHEKQSFEAKKRFWYSFESMKLRLKYIFIYKKYYLLFYILLIKWPLGLMVSKKYKIKIYNFLQKKLGI